MELKLTLFTFLIPVLVLIVHNAFLYYIISKKRKKKRKTKEKDKKKNTFHILLLNSADRKDTFEIEVQRFKKKKGKEKKQ